MNNPHSNTVSDGHADYRDAFNMFDSNGDGFITSEKLLAFLVKCNFNVNMHDVNEIIRTVDTKGNGCVDFDDFTKATHKYNVDTNETNEQEVINVFKLFDKEGTGMVNRAQMKAILSLFGEALPAEEVDEVIMEADVDGDGYIDYAEFVRMMLFQ